MMGVLHQSKRLAGKIVSETTYNVSNGMLNFTQLHLTLLLICCS